MLVPCILIEHIGPTHLSIERWSEAICSYRRGLPRRHISCVEVFAPCVDARPHKDAMIDGYLSGINRKPLPLRSAKECRHMPALQINVPDDLSRGRPAACETLPTKPRY